MNESKKVFDNYSLEYDRWYDTNKKLFQNEIECIKKVLPSNYYSLEIGAGTGRFSEKLGINIAFDYSIGMLKIAKKRGLEIVCGDAEKLPFKDSSFDCVFFVTSICFIKSIKKAVLEAKRVLKSKGYVVVGFINRKSALGQEYNKKKSSNKFYKWANFFSFKEVKNLFEQNGFKIKSYNGVTLSKDYHKRVKAKKIDECDFITILFINSP